MNVLRQPTKFDLALRVGLLLIFILAVEQPAGPLVTLGPPHTVSTNNPKAGVHTRLTDEGAPWKIQRDLQLVREMGAPWIVEFFPWAYIEYGQNGFDWWHTDQVIDQARAQGLTVIARLGLVPAWARPDPREQETTFNYLDPEHYSDFGDFVYAFVDRYRDRVDHIIIWNEPNLSFQWGLRPVDAAAYVALLKVAYRRAKEANPKIS